jgi:hypothetical protein
MKDSSNSYKKMAITISAKPSEQIGNDPYRVDLSTTLTGWINPPYIKKENSVEKYSNFMDYIIRSINGQLIARTLYKNTQERYADRCYTYG